MKSLIVTALMGMVAAHYGLDNTPDTASQQAIAPPAAQSIPTPSSIAAGGNFDLPVTQALQERHDRDSVERAALVPRADAVGLQAPAALAPHIEQGVAGLDEALLRMPRVAVAMARSIDQHGIAALAYDDPTVKKETDKLGQALGRGLGGIAQALAKDMTETAQRNRI